MEPTNDKAPECQFCENENDQDLTTCESCECTFCIYCVAVGRVGYETYDVCPGCESIFSW